VIAGSLDGIEEDAGGGIERELAGFGPIDPTEFLGFVIELDLGKAGDGAGVVEEEEVGVLVELGRVDGILDEDEPDVLDVEAGFLVEFADEGGFGGFAPFDLAAGDSPEIGPFGGADEEHAAFLIEDEAADGGDGGEAGGGWDAELEVVSVEEGAEFAEVFDDEVGIGAAELIESVVSGEDSDALDAAVAGGFDVMFHVADEHGVIGGQAVILNDGADAIAFVMDAEVGVIEEGAEAGGALLGIE
jgi:hypothetical protein